MQYAQHFSLHKLSTARKCFDTHLQDHPIARRHINNDQATNLYNKSPSPATPTISLSSLWYTTCVPHGHRCEHKRIVPAKTTQPNNEDIYHNYYSSAKRTLSQFNSIQLRTRTPIIYSTHTGQLQKPSPRNKSTRGSFPELVLKTISNALTVQRRQLTPTSPGAPEVTSLTNTTGSSKIQQFKKQLKLTTALASIRSPMC